MDAAIQSHSIGILLRRAGIEPLAHPTSHSRESASTTSLLRSACISYIPGCASSLGSSSNRWRALLSSYFLHLTVLFIVKNWTEGRKYRYWPNTLWRPFQRNSSESTVGNEFLPIARHGIPLERELISILECEPTSLRRNARRIDKLLGRNVLSEREQRNTEGSPQKFRAPLKAHSRTFSITAECSGLEKKVCSLVSTPDRVQLLHDSSEVSSGR